MSEYVRKQALVQEISGKIDWLIGRSEDYRSCGHENKAREFAFATAISEFASLRGRIQSGAFDADGEVQRLRAALEDIRYQIQQSDHPAGLGILATINQALSTTEPTSAERVREIDELMAIHKEKISYHRQNGNLTQEYFYRGYNAALHRERNRLVGVGINAPEGDGNDA